MTRTPSPRLVLAALGLTYIAVGVVGALPSASLIRLARNTHVSLQVAGGIFTSSALGFLLGALVSGPLTGRLNPKYIQAAGLFLLALGGVIIPWASSFPLLMISQFVKGIGYGCIDIGLNTIATLVFAETLSEKLNTIHGMYGLGALIGPLLLSFGLQFFASLPFAYLVGVIVALIAIALLLLQSVPGLPRPAKEGPRAKGAASRETRAVLRQGLLWLLVAQISIYVAAEMGFGNWIVTAVSESARISLVLAAPVATAFFLGMTVGRLGGAQVLKRGWLSESRLLATALLGGALSGALVAIFPGQLAISYAASAVVGCCYGPLFPSLMAIASRKFAHAVGLVGSVMTLGTGVAEMVVPTGMGLLIPLIGIYWVMAIPAACCLLVLVPLALQARLQPIESASLSELAEQPE